MKADNISFQLTYIWTSFVSFLWYTVLVVYRTGTDDYSEH